MIRQANLMLAILVSFLAAYWLRFGDTVFPSHYLVALIVTIIVSSIILPSTGAFRDDFKWDVMRRLRRLVAGWAVVLLMLIGLAAALKTTNYYSRIWFVIWALLSFFGLIMVVLVSHYAAIRKRNRSRRENPVVLVGNGDAALRVENQINNDPSSDIFILERFGEQWSEQPVRPISDLANYIANHQVHAVWIATPWEDKRTLDDSLHELRQCVIDIHVVPDFEQYRLLNQGISQWGSLPVISLAGFPMTSTEKAIKNLLDWLGALILLILLSPIIVLISFLIKVTSPGPIFFGQKRHGLGGEPINILKFRSMKADQENPEKVIQAKLNDERLTRIGGFLRKTSLDELPQLINVLKGEMSLVGPRPHAVEHNDLYKSRIPRYMLRHKVKPGITGWAQVNGYRGRTDTDKKMELRIEHDLWYIQNWSLWLDLKILMITPLVMIHKNAY